MYHVCAWPYRDEKRLSDAPGTRVIRGFDLPSVSVGRQTCVLSKQLVLLMAEPFLHPHWNIFKEQKKDML